MTFTALLTAAIRFQRRHILARTVAVAAGLVMVVATLELQGALDRSVAEAPADFGPQATVVVRGSAVFATFGAVQRPGIPVDAVAGIASAPGVLSAEGEDQGPIGVIADGDRARTRLGTWFQDDGLRPATLVLGGEPAETAVGISTELADRLQLDVGDPLELVGRTRVQATVAAIVENRGSGAPDVYAAPLTANAIVGRDGEVGRVVLTGGPSEDALASAVFVANPQFETLTRADYDTERTDAERDRANGTRRLITLFAGIAVAVTVLIVLAGTAAAVVRRTGELATLRTAGATPRQVRGLVLAEAATVGLVGGLLAGPLGTLMALGLQSRSDGLGLTLTDLTPRLDLGVIAVAVGLGVVLGVTGAWFPARRAGRLSVRAALGDLGEPTGRVIGRAAAVGAAVAAAGLVLSGTGSRADNDLGRAGLAGFLLVAGSCILAAALVGVAAGLLGRALPVRRWPVARLAVGNLARSPARTAGTAVSILVGIGLVMLTSIFTSSFQANVAGSVDRLYRADAVVTPAPSMPGVARTESERVAGLTGVAASTPVRQGPVKLGVDVGTAIALDQPARFLGPAFSSAAVASLDDEGILVRSSLGLARGAKVTVTGAEGEVETTVAATFSGRIIDGSGAQIDAVLPLAIGDQVFAPGPDLAILVGTSAGTATGPAELARQLPDDRALEVQGLAGYGAQTASSADRAFRLSLALLAMTLVTAVIGLANTVAASIGERRREISVLRALGLGAGQLARLVTLETAILASLVAVAAALVAVGAGSLLISSVAPVGTPTSIPWLRIGVIGVVATALCSTAGVVPAWLATRIPVSEGLVDE